MTRFFASLYFGALAFMAARAAGIPVWTGWTIGDAFDFGLCAFMASFFTLAALATPSSNTQEIEP